MCASAFTSDGRIRHARLLESVFPRGGIGLGVATPDGRSILIPSALNSSVCGGPVPGFCDPGMPLNRAVQGWREWAVGGRAGPAAVPGFQSPASSWRVTPRAGVLGCESRAGMNEKGVLSDLPRCAAMESPSICSWERAGFLAVTRGPSGEETTVRSAPLASCPEQGDPTRAAPGNRIPGADEPLETALFVQSRR